MNLTEMISAIRTELQDDGTLWTDDELKRCITEAVADLTRFFPREAVHEETIIYEVENESWTAAASAGTWVSLANKPIEYDSEMVKDNAGVECERDTDYYMDYSNGRITHIDGGKIANGEACTISYKKSRISIDVSGLDIIRINRVEFPLGKIPQQFVTFDFSEDIITLMGADLLPQMKVSKGQHVAIHYYTAHSIPTTTSPGSYPRFMDEVIIKGASAYALLMRAIQYYNEGVGKVNVINLGEDVPALYQAYADRYRADGLERRNEFWQILRDRAESRRISVTVSPKQLR